MNRRFCVKVVFRSITSSAKRYFVPWQWFVKIMPLLLVSTNTFIYIIYRLFAAVLSLSFIQGLWICQREEKRFACSFCFVHGINWSKKKVFQPNLPLKKIFFYSADESLASEGVSKAPFWFCFWLNQKQHQNIINSVVFWGRIYGLWLQLGIGFGFS